MRRLPRSLAVLGLVLSVSGCSALLDLELRGALDRPEVVFVDPFGGRHRRVCTDEIQVSDEQGRAHWSVRAAGERCVPVERIVYGETPAGFVQVVAPEPLMADTRYSVWASGWTGRVASVPWRGGAEVRYGPNGWERTTGS